MSGAPRPDLVARLRAAGVVFAEEEAVLLDDAAVDTADLRRRVARRCAGEPLEWVVGWAAFDGLAVPVHPGVFVPRRRTEALVAAAVARLTRPTRPARLPQDPGRAPTVLDLCCGTGALGLAVAHRLDHAGRDVRLLLADLDERAVANARVAAETLGCRSTTVLHGDLWDAVPASYRGELDAVLANVPYVPTTEVDLLPREAREHEPRATVDGGPDGLDLLRRVGAGAPPWLAPGGHVLSEVTPRQVGAARAAWEASGLDVQVVTDPASDATVVIGTHGTRGTRGTLGTRRPA